MATAIKKIKILHVAEAAGGVDRYLKYLFKYMDKDKYENIFICSQNFKESEYRSLACHVEQIHMVHAIDQKEDIKAVKQIRALIKKYKPEVVYGHSSKAGALLRLSDLGIKNKVLYNPHGWAFNMRVPEREKKQFRMIEKIQIPFTDRVICISESEKESALREHICKAEKLQVIENGIDIEESRKTKGRTREELGIPEDALVVGMVGRLTEQKAPDIFIEMAHLIKEQASNAFFIIVGDSIAGDSTWRDKTLELIDRYKLGDSFLITGWVDDPAVYMPVFDVGVLLSRWEGFGLVIPEFMASGVPVVATRVDAIPYIIEDGKNGLLVDADNAAQAKEAVFKALEMKEELVKEGRNRVISRYDAKRVAAETEKLVSELL